MATEISSWAKTFGAEFAHLVEQTAAYLPRLLLAAVIVLIGWLAARLVRVLSLRLLLGLDRLWHRVITHRGLEQLEPHYPPARIAGEIVFWFIILFTVAAAASVLGLGAFASWLSQVASYIPILLTGLLIILAGVIISTLLRDLVVSSAYKAGIARGDLLGRFAQLAILVTAIALGIDQIGIDISFLSVVIGVLLAATLGGMALAFGLGARVFMSNVIAGHQLQQHYRPGDHLRVREFDGTIVELTATRVVLSTAQGRVIIPAKVLDEELSILQERRDHEVE